MRRQWPRCGRRRRATTSSDRFSGSAARATARTPGLGSAIFLHINIGMPTAGCVTLPAGELLEILRWLNPAASPRIVMGVGALGMGAGTLGG